jgi:hypothetical protein
MQTHTRVYDSYAQAQKVVRDLETAGIPSGDISLVANKYVSDKYANVTDVDAASTAATGAGIGAAVGGGTGLLAGIGLLAIPGLGPVVAAGWLAATAVGALAGSATGGLIGALMASGETEENAHVYSEAVRRGGTLVTVRADESRSTLVMEILDRHAPVDAATRRAEYTQGGWEAYDPAQQPYKPSQAEIDRIRRI